jgi:hypothetical protein
MSEQLNPTNAAETTEEPKKTPLEELSEKVLNSADSLADEVLAAIPEGQGRFTRKDLANRYVQKLLINDLQTAVSKSIGKKVDEAEKAAAAKAAENAPTK